MVNALKAEVKKLKYADFKANTWDEVISGEGTYKDLNRTHGLAINGQKITNEFINDLYSNHKNLILRDENGKGNYRPFLRQIFTEMFKHVGATIPNNSIIEELINNYYQGGYTHFLPNDMNQALGSFHLSTQGNCMTREYIMDCREPNCIKLSFSMKYTKMLNYDDCTYIETPGFCSSAEFKLKCKDENVTYEDGKVLLTIPKELEDYKAGDDGLFDKLTYIINKLIEYFKKLCEKLGFEFDTRIEYDPERNIKIEHNLGEPLKVVSEANASSVEDLKLKVNN